MSKPPVSKPKAEAAYLAKTSPRFREIHETLGRTVQTLFPEAGPAFAFGMPGWRIARRRRIDPRSVKGALDPDWVQIYLVERKSGITFHLWNPIDFGCIQFNRTSDYPIGAVEALLQDVPRSVDADAGKPGATGA